jgi:hypothetical protein
MTIVFNGQGFSTLPREEARAALTLLVAAMLRAKEAQP